MTVEQTFEQRYGLPVTADPSRYPERPAAFFVVTDQGVRLAGPYATRTEALAARRSVVERLRVSMAQERFTGAQIAARARAVTVAYGALVGPWQRFVPVDILAPGEDP